MIVRGCASTFETGRKFPKISYPQPYWYLCSVKRFYLVTIALTTQAISCVAQVPDALIGLARAKAINRMGELRTMDYDRDRMTYRVAKGISQTLLFEHDTCRAFYWTVKEANRSRFHELILATGFAAQNDSVWVKGSQQIRSQRFSDGSRWMYFATIKAVPPPKPQPDPIEGPIDTLPLPRPDLFAGPWRTSVLGWDKSH